MRLPRLVLAALVAAGPALAQVPAPASAPAPFRFAAFGDMPYCQPDMPQDCPDQEARVARLMREVNAARPVHTIFLGDTKGGAEICSDDRLLRAFTFFGLLNHPLVYTPGDNEWTDCWQDRAGRFDPLERLALLRARFFADDRPLGGGDRRPLEWQGRVDPRFRTHVENARWRQGGVLFATLHVTGSNNNRPTEPGEGPAIFPPPGAREEFEQRDAANTAWLRDAFAIATREGLPAVVLAIQADLFYVQRCGRPGRTGQDSGFRAFREVLVAEARAFGRPVLLLHGDSHFLLHDRPVPEAPNLTRLMVPGDRETRAVVVDVTPGAADPWAVSLVGPDDRVMPNRC
ncbi:hypothetical protein [Falsiroseomonas sp. CW058]|uniref:hypothetical protein n=1 Tax=Falsiroseomonas sp. CW058 TaxID=3388664 RepID=UPI003D316B3C